jgi:hypothetical protein
MFYEPAMVRILLGVASFAAKALLLAVAIASVALWLWGRRVPSCVELTRFTRAGEGADSLELWLASLGGRVSARVRRIEWSSLDDDTPWARMPSGWSGGLNPGNGFIPDMTRRWGPVSWRSETYETYQSQSVDRCVAVPGWLPPVVTGTWPVASLTFRLRRRLRGRRHAALGRCAGCGYDLRATPAGDGSLLAICPECGRVSSEKGRDGVSVRQRRIADVAVI